MKQILCPVDFSKASHDAAAYAAAIAVVTDAHLRIAHFYESPALFTDAPFTVIHDAAAQMAASADRKMKRLVKKLQKAFPRLRADSIVSQGIAGISIVEAADVSGADLVVVGATGAGKVKRILIGSTAAKVLRDAHCAVLTIPAGKRFEGLRRIGFATDLNEDNLQAAAALVPFARIFGSEIDFVFVDDRHILHSEESVSRMTKRIRSRIRYAKIAGYLISETDVVKGVQSFVKKRKCDMLVFFTHHRSFPETLFHPSVTRLVSDQASLPVLSLRMTDRPL